MIGPETSGSDGFGVRPMIDLSCSPERRSDIIGAALMSTTGTASASGEGMEETRAVMQFEDALKAGDEVEARWTNSYSAYRARARVVRVNRKSVRVELLVAPDGYRVGQAFSVPRFVELGWSVNNRVAPLPGKETA